MTDVTRLAAGLREYQAALDRHQAEVAGCRERLECSLVRLATTYDGVAAREFAAHWARTVSRLKDYHDGTRAIATVLAARLSSLEEADRHEER